MAMFTTLNGQDLISMGVKAFGARRTMLNSIEGLLSFLCCLQDPLYLKRFNFNFLELRR